MENELETVAVPKTFWDQFVSLWKPEEKQEDPIEEDTADEFSAVVQERDDYKAQLEALNAEKAEAELFSAIAKEFETEDYGAGYKAIAEEDGAVEKLANIKDEEIRKWVLEKFAALSAQKDIVTEEIGDDESLPEGADGFEAAINAYMQKNEGVKYAAAVVAVAKDKPELYAAYKGGK